MNDDLTSKSTLRVVDVTITTLNKKIAKQIPHSKGITEDQLKKIEPIGIVKSSEIGVRNNSDECIIFKIDGDIFYSSTNWFPLLKKEYQHWYFNGQRLEYLYVL